MLLAEPKIYARKEVNIDIDSDGEKEEAVAFLLSGSFVLKLRKVPPEKHIQAWRKVQIKPGVTANVAILKPEYKGPRDGQSVLTSIWYDLDHLAEVKPETRSLILELLKMVPEEEMTEEQKKALSKLRRMKLGGDNMRLFVKLTESAKEFWHNILPFGEFYYRGQKLKITREMCERMVKNFKAGIPHYKLPVNISHNDVLGKYGNITDLEVKEDGLWAHIVLTEEGTKLLEAEKFEYLSAEFDMDYVDKRTGKNVGPTLLGVALTNRPAHPGMNPIRLEEEVLEVMAELEEVLEDEGLEEVTTLALTKEDKEEFLKRIRREDTPQLLEAHKWLHAYAASGKIPEGATKQDLIWMHNAIVKELNRRKKEKGQKVEKHPTPLKFEVEEPTEVELNDNDEVFTLCIGQTFAKLRARKKKKKKKLEEVNEVDEKVVKLEETIVKLREELRQKEEQVKKLSEENEQLKKKLKQHEAEAWAKTWIEKGIPPAVVEKAKTKILEDKADMKIFDEVFENMPKVALEQKGSENVVQSADAVAKAIWGGES